MPEAAELELGKVGQTPARAALTGRTVSPPDFRGHGRLLGRRNTLARLQDASAASTRQAPSHLGSACGHNKRITI
ncbi:MAG: hypothetical protein U5M50_00105 [Sphingobium sp.]|nr:hypothetical protein [Sphingobium sp.]